MPGSSCQASVHDTNHPREQMGSARVQGGIQRLLDAAYRDEHQLYVRQTDVHKTGLKILRCRVIRTHCGPMPNERHFDSVRSGKCIKRRRAVQNALVTIEATLGLMHLPSHITEE